MVNAIIRVIKFLILIVPILVAIVDCNDDPDVEKPPTVYEQLPAAYIPPVAGHLVIDLVDGSDENELFRISTLLGTPVHWTHPESWDEALAVTYVNNMAEAALLLEGDPAIEIVEPQMEFKLVNDPNIPLSFPTPDLITTSYPNDPMFEKQWHMTMMGAPYGWKHTPRGKGVIVAVADTGVTIVEDLKDTKVLEGKSFVGGDPGDRQGHGTHVTGTIAQSTNNGIGTVGVAPEATILPVKVLTDQGYGSSDGIAAGIDWAVDQGADVINLSLGGSYSRIIHNAIKKATEKGVIVVAACGNSGTKACGYPGGLEETIGVSALGPDGNLSFYSDHGKGVDIAAPGGDKSNKFGEEGGVLQNVIGGGGTQYAYYQGTSMATPHVAGAAAILRSAGVSPEDTVKILLDSADDSDGDQLRYGHGKLDLEAAIKMADVSPDGLGHNHMVLFLVAGLLALALGVFSEVNRKFMVQTAVASSLIGGGIFVLAEIPFLSGIVITVLSTPLLEWPNVLLWAGAAGFPLWCSAALPALIGFIFGSHRLSRPVAAGLAVGFGANLLWAAAAGTVAVWAVPAWIGTTWLVANGLGSLFLGLALFGAQHLEEVHNV